MCHQPKKNPVHAVCQWHSIDFSLQWFNELPAIFSLFSANTLYLPHCQCCFYFCFPVCIYVYVYIYVCLYIKYILHIYLYVFVCIMLACFHWIMLSLGLRATPLKAGSAQFLQLTRLCSLATGCWGSWLLSSCSFTWKRLTFNVSILFDIHLYPQYQQKD